MNLTKQAPHVKGQKRKRQPIKSVREHPASEFGTDAQFRDWVTQQPSALDCSFDRHDGIPQNIACHVRRSANSGTSIKPPYCCVPLRDLQHKFQHQHGEAASLERFYPAVRTWTPEQAKEWFDNQARAHLLRWVQSVAGRKAMEKVKQQLEPR